jgi:hypothetical protein
MVAYPFPRRPTRVAETYEESENFISITGYLTKTVTIQRLDKDRL